MTNESDKIFAQLCRLNSMAKKQLKQDQGKSTYCTVQELPVHGGLALWELKTLTEKQLKNLRKTHVRDLWKDEVGHLERVIERIDEELQSREDQEDQ